MSLVFSVNKLIVVYLVSLTLATKKVVELQNRPGFFDHPVVTTICF